MDWEQARARSVAHWQRILGAIGTGEPFELMQEVNAVIALCEMARREARAHGDWRTCRYCLAFQQIGGCSELQREMMGALIARNWDRARQHAAHAIALLEALEVPAATSLAI